MVEERLGLAELNSHIEELTRLMLAARTGPPQPDRLIRFAARAVPHSAHCGLTLIRGRKRPQSVAVTGKLPGRVDDLQYETGQGPCLEACEESDIARADDLEIDEQWPDFGRRCVTETPVRSMFGVRLFLSGEDRGAINFYAEKSNAFDDLDVGVGAIFAPLAALALQSALHEQEAAHLQVALQSSRQIGTAIGILMARKLITSDQAFDQLVHASQHLNRKLRDIAAEVEHTGQLPDVLEAGTDRLPRGRAAAKTDG